MIRFGVGAGAIRGIVGTHGGCTRYARGLVPTVATKAARIMREPEFARRASPSPSLPPGASSLMFAATAVALGGVTGS